MTDDLFHQELIDVARNPSYYGAIKNADLVLHETNASCGDQLTLYIIFNDSKNPLSPIKVLQWTGEGCIISQATMSYVAEYAQGKTLAEAQNVTVQRLQEWLGIENIALGRVKCVLLGTTALKKAAKVL